MSEQGELNIEEASAGIAADLGISTPAEEVLEAPVDGEHPEPTPAPEPAAKDALDAAQPAAAVRPPPKSWAKEAHEYWSKLEPKAQDYIETRERQMLDGLEAYKENNSFGKVMKEAITPYMPIIQAQGIEPAKAVQALLNAHYRLTQGSPESRFAAYQELGRNLGLVAAEAAGQPVDPAVREALDRVSRLEGALTQRQQQQLEETRNRVSADVNAFADAKDEKGNALHPHFDEVWTEMVVFIQAGATLEDAYDRAVWANPATRDKEQERRQALAESQAREKRKAEAEAARRATSTNVRSRDTKRTPTEPLGKMEDTLNKVFDEIQSRTTH